MWAVSGSLKKVLDYAENPEKTSLKDVIDYASDEAKTDQELFVTGINCEAENAYEMMSETKRQFGKSGKVVAYHGYQSFKEGEVTPEECHAIGVETAKRLWGNRYEVLVTTHLNTESHLHNHFVLNSVSFVDGEKFKFKTADIYALREVSDAVCKEFGKSVLENAPFRSNSQVYWIHRNGGLTQTDIVKDDIDLAIAHSYSPQSFVQNMYDMGYRFNRSIYNEQPSIFVPDRNKPIRLKSFGADYTKKRIFERIAENRYTRPKKIKYYFPLYRIHGKRKPTWADSLFALYKTLLAILELMLAKPEEKQVPISPELRYEIQKLDKYIRQQEFLTVYKIETVEELSSFIGDLQAKMDGLLEQRKQLDNKIRRAASPEVREDYKAERRKLSGQIAVIREDIATAKDIESDASRLVRVLENEYRLERKQYERNREKER
ncbi:MAG: relaxase/mobilization nuclease domain-containing protein [Oscillospiraceae bacterium]|nr:relaxase/mobilization nuclease domain-containing protein [Oscillospiraceae bacterium]